MILASANFRKINQNWQNSRNLIHAKISSCNPFEPSIAFLIETIHLICRPNQMTGFYRKYNTGMEQVKACLRKVSNRPSQWLVQK